MKATTSFAVIFCLLVAVPLRASQRDQRNESRDEQQSEPIYAGSVETVLGSPVVLSDARFSMPPSDWQPGAVKLAGKVRIENVSGKEISRLVLAFHYLGGPAGDLISGAEARTLASVGSVDFAEAVLVKGPMCGAPSLSVMATGAMFSDGSYWAAPRSSLPLMTWACFSTQSGAGVNLTACELAARSYKASLQIRDQHVVAYKLGMVKDTPTDFQVSLGEWVDVNPEHRNRGAELIDSGQSLPPARLFDREYQPFICRGKEVAKLPAGAAIFVASVAYDDGRVWVQDTSRDALLWHSP